MREDYDLLRMRYEEASQRLHGIRRMAEEYRTAGHLQAMVPADQVAFSLEYWLKEPMSRPSESTARTDDTRCDP